MSEMNFTSEVVIGLEIHVELDTKTKLFCSCTTEADEPNSATCEVCLGHPGSKPVLNKKALDFSTKFGLALGCTIAPELVFSRKTYFYPDMAKNYQITQYELPLGSKGVVELSNGSKVGITRIHMEEDPASLVHPAGMHGSSYVLMDYNRSGRPLCEVVTEPDMTSADEARDFMKQLVLILQYLNIFDVNRCIIKADANVSIKESGYVRSEIKNVTGFKEIERALEYEIERQKQAMVDGEKLVQDTRSWDSDKGITRRVRIKETEMDYGYILDSDLVPIELTTEYVDSVKADIPELHFEKRKRYMSEFGLALDFATVIASEKNLAEMFEQAIKSVKPDLAAKWIRREVTRVANYHKMALDQIPLNASSFAELLKLIEKKDITDNVGSKILEKLFEEDFSVSEYVETQGLKANNDTGALEKFIQEAMDENPKAVEDIRSGNDKSINFLVGQVMRKTRGSAAPDVVLELLKKMI